jgi:hypothetical protein
MTKKPYILPLSHFIIAATAVGFYSGSIKEGLFVGVCWLFGALIFQVLINLINWLFN